MLIGDFNVCPDLVTDRDNYRSDNRKGSRIIINSWIKNDVYRDPEKRAGEKVDLLSKRPEYT